jgi:hypothetical protein
MDCPSCGFANPPAFKFCGSCAAPLRPAGACLRCAFVNPPGFKFCGECAGPIEASPLRPSPASPTQRDPRAYTPKYLADRILASKSALEGGRKQVTVLFADVKGSMEPAARLDSEARHAALEHSASCERADRWIADTGATNLAAFVAWKGAGLCELRGDARERPDLAPPGARRAEPDWRQWTRPAGRARANQRPRRKVPRRGVKYFTARAFSSEHPGS